MSLANNLYVMCKVTPVFPSGTKADEYIVSEDFFYPLAYFQNESNSNNSYEPYPDCDRFMTAEERYSAVDFDEFLQESDCPTETESLCPCIQSLAFQKFRNRVKVRIDSVFFALLMLELKRSRNFRRNILSNFFVRYVHERRIGNVNVQCLMCSRRSMKVHAIIYLTSTKKNVLDYKWGRKIQILVNEKCELENAMAWLSTLGGAFSALGDHCIEWAIKAGSISMQQLYIGLRLGDPLTICRCKIYLAMSLLQRGYYKKTKQMIREQYKFATEGEGVKDFRLRNMCLAVWNRLRYTLSQKHIKKIKAQ